MFFLLRLTRVWGGCFGVSGRWAETFCPRSKKSYQGLVSHRATGVRWAIVQRAGGGERVGVVVRFDGLLGIGIVVYWGFAPNPRIKGIKPWNCSIFSVLTEGLGFVWFPALVQPVAPFLYFFAAFWLIYPCQSLLFRCLRGLFHRLCRFSLCLHNGTVQ